MPTQGFILPMGRRRYFDVNGAPLAFGKLYFYEAGGSTPQNTWSNSDLSSLNANPVILSASGECTVFVAEATLYKEDLYDADNNQQPGYPVDGLESLPAPDPAPPTPSPVPTGGIIAYGGTSAPTGYLICNGALVSRTTYAALFTAIGIAYGAGDASTTFGLPDLRQRFPLGTATSGTGSTLGGTGGAIDHTHTGPSHTHTTVVPRDGWGSALNLPSVTGRMNVGDAAGVAEFQSSYQSTADQTITSSAAGTGATGAENPPFQAVNWIVKT